MIGLVGTMHTYIIPGQNTRPTIVGYKRNTANARLWYACTPSATLHRVTANEAIRIMACQTMAGWTGANTLATWQE